MDIIYVSIKHNVLNWIECIEMLSIGNYRWTSRGLVVGNSHPVENHQNNTQVPTLLSEYGGEEASE